jgi:predicted porin
MQKKVIALAVAALASSAAFAQTNVTIYGVVDVGQAFVKSSGAANGDNQATVGRLTPTLPTSASRVLKIWATA